MAGWVRRHGHLGSTWGTAGTGRKCCIQQVSPAAWHMDKAAAAWMPWSCLGTFGGSSLCAKHAATCGCRWAKQSAWRERQAQQREEQQRQAAASLQQLVASVDHLQERLHHSMQVRGSSVHEHWDLICIERACTTCAQQHAGAWRSRHAQGEAARICMHCSMQLCGSHALGQGRLSLHAQQRVSGHA